MKWISIREASEIIGCSTSQTATLARKGILKSRKFPTTSNRHGYFLKLNSDSVQEYASQEQSGGWPRGKARS